MANIKIEFNPCDEINIEYSFREAIRISRVLGVGVLFTFNDVKCFAHPDGDIDKGVDAYHDAIEKQWKGEVAKC